MPGGHWEVWSQTRERAAVAVMALQCQRHLGHSLAGPRAGGAPPAAPLCAGAHGALPLVPALSLWVCLQRACVFAARMVLPRLCLFTRTGARSMREEAHGLSLCPRPGSRQRTEAAAASELSRLQWLTPIRWLERLAEGYLGFLEYVQTPVV